MMASDLRLLFWELTARCNLRCRHCRADAQPEAEANELSTDEILQVMQTIRRDADPILILTGGEPLAREDFFRLAEAATAQFTRVALATNGTLIDEAVAAQIADTGIQRVSISLDGATAASHEGLRGVPGCFAAALRGLDALRETGVSVQANVTATRQNLDEMPELLAMMQARGVDAFHLFLLVPVGCGAEISPEQRVSSQESEALLTWLCEQAIALRGQMHIKATCAPTYYRIMRQVARERGMALSAGHGMTAMTRGCLAGSGVCFISRTGAVQPCGYLPLAVGNVRERSLGEIWRSAAVFTALRDPDRLQGKCGRCGYRHACMGCRARAYAATGNFLDADADCPYGVGEEG
jgi:radical SAM protein with 4Fe4S-binding SPASM domain